MPDNSDSAETAQDRAKSTLLEAIQDTEKLLGEGLAHMKTWVQMRRTIISGDAFLIVLFLITWTVFSLSQPHTTTASLFAVLLFVGLPTFGFCAWTVFVYFVSKFEMGSANDIFFAMAASLLNIVTGFTFVYFYIGTGKNFSAPLTHVDAIYFTVGTLTTAGTGSLSATSQLSRAVVSLQMMVDLIFLAVTVVIAIQKALAMQGYVWRLPKCRLVNRWRENAQHALTHLQSARQKLEGLTGDADPESALKTENALAEANSAMERSSKLLGDLVRLWRQPESTVADPGQTANCPNPSAN